MLHDHLESEQLVNIEAVVSTAAAGTVVLGAVGEGARRVYKHTRAYFKRLELHAKQLEPNGGSSMRDDMTHVRKSIDTIGDQLRAVSVDLLGVHTKLDEVVARQDAHERTEAN
jgi:hypothetical protein